MALKVSALGNKNEAKFYERQVIFNGLLADLRQYLSEDSARALLGGEAIELELDTQAEVEALQQLMPKVVSYVRRFANG